MKNKVDEIVSKMTLEEKASVVLGDGNWYIKAIESANLGKTMMTDGPHGLRKVLKEGNGVYEVHKSTCLPPAVLSACSFDKNLLYSVGQAIAQEALDQDVSIVLGPGVNIKRNPLCGRNFEYFSEDPFLAGKLAASFINGVQSKNIGCSLKHFAMNNQETRRMTIDSVVDDRTFNELYLKPFEIAVKESNPWTVMCSYNSVRGHLSSQNSELLNDILRKQWGFKGLVMSDWGAVDNRVEGLKSGLDLEMPSVSPTNSKYIIQAIKNGSLSESVLNKSVKRVVELVLKTKQAKKEAANYKLNSELSSRVAKESIVLLKNEESLLPLDKNKKVAFVGAFIEDIRYQGSGSSRINPTKIEKTLDLLKISNCDFTYSKGYSLDSNEVDNALEEEAIKEASNSDCVVLYCGLPDSYESEGFDRTSIKLPNNQLDLAKKLYEKNANLVIVLLGGSVMDLSILEYSKSAILPYLGGQAVSNAILDIIYGEQNPCGRLAETFAKTLEDYPSTQNFPGTKDHVFYKEGLYVGYRYFTTFDKEVVYPFGYGLSYTNFEYTNMDVVADLKNNIVVSFDVTNIGLVDGYDTPQIYVSKPDSNVYRPKIELKGFEKVFVPAGQTVSVKININASDLEIYSIEKGAFVLEEGSYIINLAKSSLDVVESSEVNLKGFILKQDNIKELYLDGNTNLNTLSFEKLLGHKVPAPKPIFPYHENSLMTDIQHSFFGRRFYSLVLKKSKQQFKNNPEMQRMIDGQIKEAPIRMFLMNEGFTHNIMYALLNLFNHHYIKAIKYFILRNKE